MTVLLNLTLYHVPFPNLIFLPDLYPYTTCCGGDIVTLQWFRLQSSIRVCVCPSFTLNLVDMKENNRYVPLYQTFQTYSLWWEVELYWFWRPEVKTKVTLDIYWNKSVNMKETKPLWASPSNFADMLTAMRGSSILIVEFRGQRSRSQWTYMQLACEHDSD